MLIDKNDSPYLCYHLGTQYRNNMLVTASHAIFLNSTWNGRDDGAPAAVVGFQFLHTAFHSLFINITYNVSTIHVFN